MNHPYIGAAARDHDLFELRAYAHERNIHTLDDVLTSILERANRINSLQRKLEGERGEIDVLMATLARRLRAIEEDYGGTPPGVVLDARDLLGELRKQIDKARETVEDLAPLKIDPDSLKRRNSEFSTKLTEPRQKLVALRRHDHQPESWDQLNALGHKWVDYLDYVAGLCLLHDRVDKGICAIADALIAELVHGSKDLEALAIPGRGTRDGSLPKIVYLGFPEWTVWALPLAAHELWHIARQHADLGTGFSDYAWRKLRGQLADTDIAACDADPLLEECIADAFATYTMGPSYAYSALILSLDPVRELDRFRAATILHTLTRLVDADELSLEASQTELAVLWRGALAQAKKDVPDLSPSFVAWRDKFLDYLDNIARTNKTLRFDTKTWTSVREGLKLNLVGKGVCGREISLRFVLSAAWEARFEQPDGFGAIAERCEELCCAIKSLPSVSRARSGITERPDVST